MPNLLLQNGGTLLQETGGKVLLDLIFPIYGQNYLLSEDDTFLLQEDGNMILLDGTFNETVVMYMQDITFVKKVEVVSY